MLQGIKRVLSRWMPLVRFRGSQDYWRSRYRYGGDSGAGSTGAAAEYKAKVLNEFVRDNHIQTVIEFGCGDGQQLELARYPQYLGLDISPEAVGMCRQKFANDQTKSFRLLEDYNAEQADLALSLDVLFHLVEDQVYYEYLDRLFSASPRYVVVYSSNEQISSTTLPHVRHRHVSKDIEDRFDGFVRMVAAENDLVAPPQLNGTPTSVFLLYEKSADGMKPDARSE